ncbi:MAG: hypothetical protein ACI959_000755 [Limisphaerales bacterium]|jgi:hypothetical protein
MSSTDKSRVRRVPKRGYYDAPTIYRILDKTANCHIGFVHEDGMKQECPPKLR